MLSGMPRVWADYNMELEVLDIRPSRDIADMAIKDCRLIIADLNKRLPTQDVLNALEAKWNQLAELEKI